MSSSLSKDAFIEKANKVHNNRYDYSLVVYKGSKVKVEIVCKEHGIFFQAPRSHLFGYGCQKCGGSSRLTTKEFIEKATKKHGDKYDYSLVEYKNSKSKVKIICKIHGEFLQKPSLHLFGQGCPSCKPNALLTTEEFIKRAKEVHGDLYDYSLAEYKGSSCKINIICSVHGIFEQISKSHLSGHGCDKCGKTYSFSTKEFIEKAIQIHGNKYDYSLTNYFSSSTKVEIVCNVHGSFHQTPNDHLSGKGCKSCGNDLKKTSLEKFIEQATTVHNNLYDYSLVVYKNSRTKINILCKLHGIFSQTPHKHLEGRGCGKCKQPKNEKLTGEFLKEIFNNEVKIFPQKKFECENLIPKKRIFVDYYFEFNNKKYIVEYNGKQHYQPIQFGSVTKEEAELVFSKQQIRDEYVRNMCVKENIILIEIDGREYFGPKIKTFLQNVLGFNQTISFSNLNKTS